jgi:hypothetical protein
MKLIASDTAMRSRLIQAGLERVKNYSWERASIALWEGLQAAINRQ